MLFKIIGAKRKASVIMGLLALMAVSTMIFINIKDLRMSKSWLAFSKEAKTQVIKSRLCKILLPPGARLPKHLLRDHLENTASKDWDTLQLLDHERLEMPPYSPGHFKTSYSFLYETSRSQDCAKKEHDLKLAFDQSEAIPLNLGKVFEIYAEESETYGDTYNKHLEPVLKQYLKHDKIKSHWFRFSGSSVWLKDYNVHFVVSRLIMSEEADKKQPKISLALAQIFDEHWHEIEDVRIVFPSNSVKGSPGFTANGHHYHSYRFPRLLPIPFLLETGEKYWGAEDPRVTLVKNPNGHEEPIIMFNAFHKKQVQKAGRTEIQGFRSIFMSFPFQIQKGKQIEGADAGSSINEWFSRTKQISIKGGEDQLVEKNWIPFLSQTSSHHEHVYVFTSLDPLVIIKCELWTENGICTIEESEEVKTISPLRGGTPLISIKKLDDKEIFVGIARSHLKECGCGHHFYRPSLVVVARVGRKWTLSQVSSSFDLGIRDVVPDSKSNVCENESVVIPNGIEFWDLESDLMSVDLSASDLTVERVYVAGVLRALKRTKFWQVHENESSSPTVTCALEASRDYCKRFGAESVRSHKFYKNIFQAGGA